MWNCQRFLKNLGIWAWRWWPARSCFQLKTVSAGRSFFFFKRNESTGQPHCPGGERGKEGGRAQQAPNPPPCELSQWAGSRPETQWSILLENRWVKNHALAGGEVFKVFPWLLSGRSSLGLMWVPSDAALSPDLENCGLKEAVQSPLWLSPWPNLGSTIILSNCADDEMGPLRILVWELVSGIYKKASRCCLLDSAAAELMSCW